MNCRRGGAIVEFLVVFPILCLVLLGIVEFGTAFSDSLVLGQGAREGARQASLGSPLATIRTRVRSASFGSLSDGSIVVESYSGSTWSAVNDSPDGTTNAATSGSLVRVRIVSYPHQLVTGTYFSWLPNYSSGNLLLSAQMIVRRE